MKSMTIFDINTQNPNKKINKALTSLAKFESLLKRAHKVLFKARAVFPFDFFPDEITIDEDKVNIITHEFFFSGDIHSIAIDKIRDIQVTTGPFFASLTVVPDGYPGNHIVVHYLWKSDAIKARRLIQGLMLVKNQGIELTRLDLPDLVGDIEYLGRAHLAEM